MNKNQKKPLGALMVVAATSVTAALSIVPGKAQADEQSTSSVFDEATFTVLRHDHDKESKGHEGALIIVLATNEDKSEHALVFVPTTGEYAWKPMACSVTTKGDDWLRCVSDQGPGKMAEVLTVGDLESTFCAGLRKAHGDANAKNPIMLPDDCEAKYPKEDHPNAACVCYQIEHLEPAIDRTAGTEETLNPPGRGSGSGGHG